MLFFAIAIRQGLDQYVDATELRHVLQNMMRETGQSFELNKRNFSTPVASAALDQRSPEVHAPKGFAVLADCLETAADLTGVLSDDESDQLPGHWRQQEQILWPRKEIIYTDASARDLGQPDYYRSGAGISTFVTRCGPRIKLQRDPIDYHIGVANTIQTLKGLNLLA